MQYIFNTFSENHIKALKSELKPGLMVLTYSLSYLGGRGRKMTGLTPA